MKNNKIIYSLIAFIVFFVVLWIFYPKKEAPVTTPPVVLSFADCVSAGYPVTGTKPRQCRTPDGRTYAEELPEKITYNNATNNLITVELPFPGAVTGKEFDLIGQARGNWYFEASFPVQVLDKDGKELWSGPAQAKSDWMTTNFVPFKVHIKVPESYIGKATIVLKKDNPSGLQENEASISFPITIEY